MNRGLSARSVWAGQKSPPVPAVAEFELSTPDDYTILGVVISQEVIARHASFLHHPERVLHMLRNQSALAVREPHKGRAVGVCPTGAGHL